MTISSTLKLGSNNDSVREWQRILMASGYDLFPYYDDGEFGESTHNATISWQKEHGLNADGVVGSATIAKINTSPIILSKPLEEDNLDIKFIQATNYKIANRSEIKFIIIHSMEANEASTTAENVAKWFASGDKAPMSSAHFCVSPNTRILCDDFVWREIGQLNVGQKIWSTEEFTKKISGRTLQPAEILKYKKRNAKCLKVTFSDGRVITCSTDHKFLAKKSGEVGWVWVSAEKLKNNKICAPFQPWDEINNYDSGYLAGIFDGEGCWHKDSGALSLAQNENIVLKNCINLLNKYNINFSISKRPQKEKTIGANIIVISGIQANLKALGQFKPSRLLLNAENNIKNRCLKSRLYDNFINVISVENVGYQEVISIETSTHTYFSEGIVSHNCIDDDSIIQCVKETDVAYHAKSANRFGIGLEHAGFAKQTKEQWLDSFSTRMLQRSAKLTATLCKRWNIPIVYINRNDLKTGAKGISTHNEVTFAFENGRGHTDPGFEFPMDLYIQWVQETFEILK